MYKLWPGHAQYMKMTILDIYLTPVTYNLPKEMFQMALLLLKGNNCAKLFRNPCIIVQVWDRTNPDGRTDARTMHIHQTKIVTTMSRLPQAGSTKINLFTMVLLLLNDRLRNLQVTYWYSMLSIKYCDALTFLTPAKDEDTVLALFVCLSFLPPTAISKS